MSYNYFENKTCEYYPCHKIEHMNCMFCYCPLYNTKCEGNYSLTKEGLKDCSECLFPHISSNYGKIIERINKNNKGEE